MKTRMVGTSRALCLSLVAASISHINVNRGTMIYRASNGLGADGEKRSLPGAERFVFDFLRLFLGAK